MKKIAEFQTNKALGIISVTADGKIIEIDRSIVSMINSTVTDFEQLLSKNIKTIPHFERLFATAIDQLRKGVSVSIVDDVIDTMPVKCEAYLASSDHETPVIRMIIRDSNAFGNNDAILQEELVALLNKNEELENFIRAVSHDIKGPLNTIEQFIRFFEKEYADLLQQEGMFYIERIMNITRRIRNLIDKLKVYYFIGKDPCIFSEVDVTMLCSSVAKEMKEKYAHCNADIVIEPLGTIEADYSMLTVLFQHLIDNALLYREDTRDPAITVTAHTDDGKTSISVIDNGIGIETKFHERIFQPLQRLHSREKYDGDGMGLAICERICNKHCGSITVFSQPGSGSVFTVSFPNKHVV